MFEIYATGNYSLSEVRRILRDEFSLRIPKSHIHRLLQNRFYLGEFLWRGKQYKGSHSPIISRELFHSVQEIFDRANRPRRQKHEFAFSGLLQCAHDGCTITAEVKKQRYIYYHCTGYRGKCELPYFREEELADRLGQVLADIHIPTGYLPRYSTLWRRTSSGTSRPCASSASAFGSVWRSSASGSIRCISISWRARSTWSSGSASPPSGGPKSSR